MAKKEPKIAGKEKNMIPLKINPEIKQIYLTGAAGGFTNYDFRLVIYNEISRQPGGDPGSIELVPESDYELIMSIKTVKELYSWLGDRIKEMEELMGEEIKTTKDKFFTKE